MVTPDYPADYASGSCAVHRGNRYDTQRHGPRFPKHRLSSPSQAQNCSHQCVSLGLVFQIGQQKANVAVFVTTDVICIFVQLAGGALFGVSAGGDSDSGVSVDTATNILMAGLILQVSYHTFSLFPSLCQDPETDKGRSYHG